MQNVSSGLYARETSLGAWEPRLSTGIAPPPSQIYTAGIAIKADKSSGTGFEEARSTSKSCVPVGLLS